MIEIKNNKKRLVISGIIIFMVIFSMGIYQLINKEVTVAIGNRVTAFKVTDDTVKELLYNNDILIGEDDYINVELDNTLEEGMEIVIKRAVPITIYNGHKKMEVNTTEGNVEGVIESLDIIVDEDDIVTPSLDKDTEEGMEIKIVKVEKVVKKIIDEIPYDIVENTNDSIFKGNTKEIKSGEEGEIVLEVSQVYENGQLKEEEIKDVTLTKEPVTGIIEKGTMEYIASSRGKLSYKNSMVMAASAYDLSYASTGKNPGDKHYGLTASGTQARPGVVAVDTRVIPLGTKLYIKSLDGWPDYGFAVAEDTGGAIKGNRIDLFMSDHSTALRFGRRKVQVYILD